MGETQNRQESGIKIEIGFKRAGANEPRFFFLAEEGRSITIPGTKGPMWFIHPQWGRSLQSLVHATFLQSLQNTESP